MSVRAEIAAHDAIEAKARVRLLADVRALRQHHEFTRDCIGQPGCLVRRQAAEYVALDAVIVALGGRVG